MFGKPVAYNKNVHLVHSQSGYYLDTFSEASEYHSFSVHLCSTVSYSSVFVLLPLYNTTSSSETVQENDSFRIKNLKTNYFLNYTTHKGYVSFLDLNVGSGIPPSKNVFEISSPRDSLNSCAIILTESGVVWSSKLIRKHDFKEDDHIISNQVVRITFPHFQSELCSDYSYLGDSDTQEEVYSKKYLGPHPEERTSMRSLWYVHADRFLDSYIDITDAESGVLYLQHFNTEKLIANQGVGKLLYLTDLDKDVCPMFVTPVLKEQTQLKQNQLYHLHSKSRTFLTLARNPILITEDKTLVRTNLINKYMKSETGKKNEGLFSPLIDEDIDEQRFVTSDSPSALLHL